MDTYRAIVIFASDSIEDATSKAQKAARSAKGELDRLTVRRETWGAVELPVGEQTSILDEPSAEG